jgi:DNA-directed RNA polymerase subunit RPC12/RpoP
MIDVPNPWFAVTVSVRIFRVLVLIMKLRILAALTLTVVSGGLLPAQEKKYVHEFHHDFRGKPLPKEIQVVGKAPGEYFKEEAEGFRITLPKTWIHAFGGVGIRTTFMLKGDFEATGAFEILHADVPAKGFGVGASLRVQQDKPDPQGATFARVVRAGGNQILFWDRGPDLDDKFVGAPVKCDANKLRLRFRRVGGTLHYEWAPGIAGGEFTEIVKQDKFGANDVTAVRMSVITGREPCDVDVRFLELHVGSGGIQENANIAPQPPPPLNPEAGGVAQPAPTNRSWLMVIAIIGATLVLLFAVGGVGLVVLVKRRAGEPASKEAATFNFFCAACGKSLRAKASAAGKKIACASCGKSVVVPEP